MGGFIKEYAKIMHGILKGYVRILEGLCKDSGRSMVEVLFQGWGNAKAAFLLQY